MMKRLIKKFTDLFKSEKKPELAEVPLDKLQHWTELQYKQLLKPTFEAIRKPMLGVKDTAKHLDLLLKEISDFRPAHTRVDVQTKVLNKKSELLKSLKSLVSQLKTIEDATELYQIYDFFKALQKENKELIRVREEVGPILREHMQKQYSQLVQLLHSLDSDFKNARQVLIQPVNKSYLDAQKLAKQISEKHEKSIYYDEKMEITKSHVKDRRSQVDELRGKISVIKNDPKYKIEKSSIQNRTNKYSLSFYDLEIDKLEKQVTELANSIVQLKEHYNKLKDAKDELDIESAMQTYKHIMLSDFLIEVEIATTPSE